MAVTDDLKQSIKYVPIAGPGIDALDRRKEVGSPVDLEPTIKMPPRAWFEKMARSWKMLTESARHAAR
jgi:hypothetical protein